MSDQTAGFVFYALALILPLSALLARRMPAGRMARLALIWVAVFAAGTLIAMALN